MADKRSAHVSLRSKAGQALASLRRTGLGLALALTGASCSSWTAPAAGAGAAGVPTSSGGTSNSGGNPGASGGDAVGGSIGSGSGGSPSGGDAATMGGAAAIESAASFRCGNWADPRDNFVNGNLVLSGLSSTDGYDSVVAKSNAILSAFETTVGANTVRVPVNEPTVSGAWWNAYKGVIDAGVARGMKVIVAYWAWQNGKEADRIAYFAMWQTVVDAYAGNNLVYFEPFNEPWQYSATDWTELAVQWVTTYPSVPKGRVIIAGSFSDTDVRMQGGDPRLDGTLLSLHIYPFNDVAMTATAGWTNRLKMYLGNYADRTIVTEWGAPMSTGVDYSASGEGDNSGSFVSAISSYLHYNALGSCYWPVLRTGDSWSLSSSSGAGTELTLTISNASGLARVQSAFNL